MKKITFEDFNFTPAELALLVEGAQRHLPPMEEPGEPLDKPEKTPTSK